MKKIQCVKSLLNKIPFSLHPAFVVVLAYCVIFGSFWSFITLTFLALVHELGHGVVAAHFGYKLKKIRLLPFGAELCGNDLFLPAHEIKIAIAGPATNLVICVVCIALMWVFPSAYSNLEIIFSSSISLALFNLLPFFPLDGGRIFVALSSKRMERQVALRLARILTIIFGSILLLLFVVSIFIYFNLSFGIMGISLIMSCIFSLPTTKYERFTSQSFKYRKIKTGLLQKHIAKKSIR